MKIQKQLQTITYRIATSLDIARANYVLYALISSNVDDLLKINGSAYLGIIQKGCKNIFSLEIHKAYTLPQESKKPVASLGYIVSELAKQKMSLNIQVDEKYNETIIEYCNNFITYDKNADYVDNIIKSYKILKKQKKCDLEKFEKVRNEFIAHSTLEQTDLKGPQLSSIRKLISDGLEFAQILYLILWNGRLEIIPEDEYLKQGVFFLSSLGLKKVSTDLFK
jgi:hypothetical protein